MHRKINRKMNKKLLTVMLTIVLLLSTATIMTAYGGGDDGDEIAKTVFGGRDSDIDVQLSSVNPSTSERTWSANAKESDPASLLDGSLLPIDTSPPAALATESHGVFATERPKETAPGTHEFVTPSPTIMPSKTLRHHMEFAHRCWCGQCHANSGKTGTHTETECWCQTEFGTASLLNDSPNSVALHHTTYGLYSRNAEVCWCGAFHDLPSSHDVVGNACECWRYDSTVEVCRHHIIGGGRTCWCGAQHGFINSQHSDYDCFCLAYTTAWLSNITPSYREDKHHVVNISSRLPIEKCWCGLEHNYHNFEHVSNVNCSCWKYDTIQVSDPPL